MNLRTVLLIGAISFCALSLRAEYTVESRGAWPKSWPQQLEPLRQQAKTYEGPLPPLLHYAIEFKSREQFEAAWPHLLKTKTPGAPIVLKAGPSFWLSGKQAGVCVHTPPANVKPVEPKPGETRIQWMKFNYIELIVDGDIVDLNRIELPRDTPIVDRRFEKKKKPVARR